MTEEKQQYEFLVCPTCNGLGKRRAGSSCPNCNGMGLGVFFEGTFYYWGLNLSRTIIELTRFRNKANKVINFTSFIIGVIGLVALGLWIWPNAANDTDLSVFAFWRIQHYLLLIFWLSVVSDMFMIYRLSQEEARSHRIKHQRYRVKKDKNTPNNWDELRKFKNRINVVEGYGPKAIKTVEDSFLLAHVANHKEMDVTHLFLVSLGDSQVAALFTRLNVNAKILLEKTKKQLAKMSSTEDKTVLGVNAKQALIKAYIQAMLYGERKVEPINFILPAAMGNETLNEVLYELEVTQAKINNVITWFIINERLLASYRRYRREAQFKPANDMDKAYTAIATPALNHFGYDLTVAAKWGKLEYCVARDDEIGRIFEQFESGHNAVILVGPVGVGKNTVVNGIAQLMVEEDVPEELKDKRLVEVDVTRLVSGASPAEAEERMLMIIDEIVKSGNVALYFNNIENMIGITAGSEESLDLSEVLVSALEKGAFYCLASATSRNYHRYIDGKSLGNEMEKIDILEPEGDQAVQIIESNIGAMEGKYKVFFSYNAIEEVIRLSQKYIHDKYLPEKAIEILESVAVSVNRTKGENSMATKEDIARVVSDITSIPTTKITENESEALLKLEDKIHERMVNQSEAVKMVSASLRRARTELREGKRPIANFLFMGPTGVGKTELAKTVSEIYFGDEEYMIRLDMSEYQYADSVKKMIGDETGVLGYLTEAVRKAPFSLVLLDEIEKAHPDIMNLFLQVMDDGRLTDGQGRTIDFTNSILIATSNAGAIFIQEQIFAGKKTDDFREALMNEHLMKVMRPELINRFDGTIVFEPLSFDNVVDIARLMLKSTARMLEVKGIRFKAEEGGIRILAKEGFDPQFGARPLRRLLQNKVDNEIANKILSGELKRRDTVYIDEEARVGVVKAKAI